jgi:PAS domain S-box-containing protein
MGLVTERILSTMDIETLRKEIEALKKENERLRSDEKSVRITREEEADYKESQIRFRTIFENSSLGNKILGKDLKILHINDAMVALLGYDNKEEIIGTRIMDYSPPEFHNHWEELQTRLWDLNIPSFSLETCLKKRDGTTTWCRVTSILFQDQGKTLGYTIIEDISEQHLLRKHKDEFISIASHELKTPLTSLQANLQLTNRIIEKETVITDKLIKLCRNSGIYVTRLNSLIGDLLSSTKIEKGHLSLSLTRFKLSGLIDNCCQYVRVQEQYTITYKGDPSLEIDADELKLDQVIVNMVNNAVKYASKSKEIIIEAEELKGFIKVSVIDQGDGIPPEKLPHIFQSYYQVTNNGNQESGMGLGLYISSEIVKRHGGEIGVTSTVGKGSTFWFTIPKTIKMENGDTT